MKMSAKSEKLIKILKDLEKESVIEGSAIVSPRGQSFASALHSDADEKAIAAMAAALGSVGAKVSNTLGAGKLNQMVLNGTDKLILMHTMKNAVLITMAPSDAKEGLLQFEIEQAIKKIKMTLG